VGPTYNVCYIVVKLFYRLTRLAVVTVGSKWCRARLDSHYWRASRTPVCPAETWLEKRGNFTRRIMYRFQSYV